MGGGVTGTRFAGLWTKSAAFPTDASAPRALPDLLEDQHAA